MGAHNGRDSISGAKMVTVILGSFSNQHGIGIQMILNGRPFLVMFMPNLMVLVRPEDDPSAKAVLFPLTEFATIYERNADNRIMPATAH